MDSFEPLRVSYSNEQIRESSHNEKLISQRDNKQQQVRKQSRGFYVTWIQDWWLLEIVSLLLSTIAILAIFIVLKHYHNQPAPTFNSILGVNITINTLMSILSTISRATLLFPVAECISQQKWFWFSTTRPLTDVETFDKGSRGAFGSLMLIWRIKLQQFVSIGAVILVLGLALDPLSQQLLHFDLRLISDPSGSAYVSTALSWDTYSQNDDFFAYLLTQLPEPPLYMKAAILNGLLTSGSLLNDTQPFCSTGNCTWPVYRSLAVCTRWRDITTHLKRSEHQLPQYNATRWSLTDRSYLETPQNEVCLLNMSSVAEPKPAKDDGPDGSNNLVFNDTVAFKDSQYPLADVFMIYANTSDSSCIDVSCPSPELGTQCRNCTGNTPLAIEFILEWCVEEYNTTIFNGTTKTTRLGSTNNFTGQYYITGPIANTTTEFPYITAMNSPPKYTVSHYTHYILSNYLRKTLSGSIYQTASGTIQLIKTSDAAEAFWQRFNRNSNLQEARNLTGVNEILQNIAISMSNIVRETEHTAFSDAQGDRVYEKAIGTAWREQNFVRVQWAWIAAPLTLLFLGLLFVSVTIAQTSAKYNKSKIWKSSSLPTLLALGDELHRNVGGIRSLSDNENGLQHTEAFLERNSDGEWKLQSRSDL